MPMRRRVLLTQDEPIWPCRRSGRREKHVNAHGLSRLGTLNQHKIPPESVSELRMLANEIVTRPHFLLEFRHL
jgi:hypothetical protein